MRAGFFVIGFIVVFAVVIDFLLYLILRKRFLKQSKTFPRWLKILHWLSPLLFTSLFALIFFNLNSFTNENLYYRITWLTGVYLLVYISKLFYIVTHHGFDIILSLLKTNFTSIGNKNGNPPKRNTITRSEFLGKATLLLTAIPFLSMLYSMSKGRFNYKLYKHTLRFKNLPPLFDGLKIVQISDIHLGNFDKQFHQLYDAVEMINAEKPDLIFFTGDLVNNFSSETEGWDTVFGSMKARLGKYSVLGNHDYGLYSRWPSLHARKINFDRIVQAHQRFGFELLRNQNVRLKNGDQHISIVGIENWGNPPFPQFGDLNKAMEGIDPETFNILLSHDPDHWDKEVLDKTPLHLTLAGHTHGMQLGFTFRNQTWSPAKWKYKYWGGLYHNKGQALYVNRGLGVIGIPMRIGMPPEITSITLRKA